MPRGRRSRSRERHERNRQEDKANCFFGAISQVILAPFGILTGGIILAQYDSTVCSGFLLWPYIVIGLFLVTSLILAFGCFFGLFGRETNPFPYVFGYLLVLLILLVFVVFGFVAVGGIDPVLQFEVREYDLKDYSGWLRDRTADQQYWDTLSACLRERNACKRMITRPLVRDPKTGIFVPEASSDERRARKHDPDNAPSVITSIESGCCKPPSSCGFTYVNGTTWTPAPTPASAPAPGAPAVETDVDCSRWSNDQQKLCFHCDSCKAGLLADIKKSWTASAFLPIFVMVTTTCPWLVLEKCFNSEDRALLR